MNFFSFDEPSVPGVGGVKFDPGFFIKLISMAVDTPTAVSTMPETQNSNQIALITQPRLTEFTTPIVGVSVAFTYGRVKSVPAVRASRFETIFFVELTIVPSRDLLRGNLLPRPMKLNT